MRLQSTIIPVKQMYYYNVSLLATIITQGESWSQRKIVRRITNEFQLHIFEAARSSTSTHVTTKRFLRSYAFLLLKTGLGNAIFYSLAISSLLQFRCMYPYIVRISYRGKIGPEVKSFRYYCPAQSVWSSQKSKATAERAAKVFLFFGVLWPKRLVAFKPSCSLLLLLL